MAFKYLPFSMFHRHSSFQRHKIIVDEALLDPLIHYLDINGDGDIDYQASAWRPYCISSRSCRSLPRAARPLSKVAAQHGRAMYRALRQAGPAVCACAIRDYSLIDMSYRCSGGSCP